MEINKATIDLVKSSEGLVLKAYPDPGTGGKPWTIGYGHTGLMSMPLVSQGDVIDDAQAEQYLKNDLNATGAIVAKYIKVELNENQFGALVSFAFNVGEHTFGKSSVVTFINKGNLDAVPGRLHLYRYANGKVLTGLVVRRNKEANLWLTPTETTDVATLEAKETNTTAGIVVKADPNGKKPVDLPAVGAVLTLGASISNDFKTALGNITEAIGIPSVWVIGAAGLAFAAWALYNRFKKDK